MGKKTKIVLDADVVIHFIKADCFSLLLDIFPEYRYLILDVVYNELQHNKSTKRLIDNNLTFFKQRIAKEQFSPKGTSLKEYATLLRTFGRGESACMVYCRDNNDVLGSSNLRDIKEYCEKNSITYLTTLDFLYYAFVRKKMTAKECKDFMVMVNAKGSRLPIVDIEKYVCNVVV